MTRSPESPSRLWLGELPTGGGRGRRSQGTLQAGNVHPRVHPGEAAGEEVSPSPRPTPRAFETPHDRDPRPDQEVRRPVRPRPAHAQAGAGRRVRVHRPERGRQDDHHAHPRHAAQPELGRGERVRVLDLHRVEGDPPVDRLHARLLRRVRRHEGDRVPGVLRRRLPHQGAGAARRSASRCSSWSTSATSATPW